MDVGAALRRLTAHPVLLVLAAVVALLAGGAAVSALPGMKSPTKRYGLASNQLLVDSVQSSLANLNIPADVLASRAPMIASFARSDTIATAAAARAGVPRSAFQIHTITTDAAAGSSGPALPQAPAAPAGSRVVTLAADSGSPIIQLTGQAPTPAEAARLTQAVGSALRGYVVALQRQQRLAPDARVELRLLGPPTASIVEQGKSKKKGVVAALAVFLLLSLAIMAYDRFRERRAVRLGAGVLDGQRGA